MNDPSLPLPRPNYLPQNNILVSLLVSSFSLFPANNQLLVGRGSKLIGKLLIFSGLEIFNYLANFGSE